MLRRVFWLAAATAGAIAGLVGFVLMTEPGARLALRLVLPRLPVSVSVTDLDGTLSGPLTLHDLRLELGTTLLTVERLELNARLLRLARRQLYLDMLSVDGAQLVMSADSAAATPADSVRVGESEETADSLLTLPLEIILADAVVRDLSLKVPDLLEATGLQLTADGSLERGFDIEGGGDLAMTDGPSGRVSLAGQGTLNGLEFESLRASMVGGEVEASGSVAWLPRLIWSLSVRADEVEPATLAPRPEEWPGRLSFRAVTEGQLDTVGPVASLRVDTLFGTLRNQRVSARLSVEARGDEYRVDSLAADWGATHVRAVGRLGAEVSLSFDLEAPNLAAVLPGAAGSLAASGQVDGARAEPRIQAVFRARGMNVAGIRVASAEGDAKVDLSGTEGSEAMVAVTGLEFSGRSIQSANLELSGSRYDHRLTARLFSGDSTIEFRIAGAYLDRRWEGTIEEMRVRVGPGAWRLARAAPLAVSADAVELGTLCMLSNGGRVCTEGSWRADRSWRAVSTVERLPLRPLERFLPEGWSLNGTLSGALDAAGSEVGPLRANADLRVTPGFLEHVANGQTQAVGFSDSSFQLWADDDSVRASLNLGVTEAERSGALIGRLELPGLPVLRQVVDSAGAAAVLADGWRLTATLERLPLELAGPFLPPGWRLSGDLDGEVEASGVGPELVIDLRADPGDLRYVLNEEIDSVRFDASRINVRGDVDSVQGELELALAYIERPGALNGRVELPGLPLLRQLVDSAGLAAVLDSDWGAEVTIEQLPLKLAGPLLPPGWRLDGELNGKIEALDAGSNLSIDVRTEPGHLRYTLGGAVDSLEFAAGRINVRGDVDSLLAELELGVIPWDSSPPGRIAGLFGSAGLPTLRDRWATGGAMSLLREDWSTELTVEDVPLAPLAVFLPEGWSLFGALNGDVRGAVDAEGVLSMNLELTPTSGALRRVTGNETRHLNYDQAHIGMDVGSDGLRAQLSIELASRDSTPLGTLTGNLHLREFTRLSDPLGTQPVDGHLEGQLDLGVLATVVDGLANTAGQLDIDITAGGTVDDIHPLGEVRISGRTEVPRLGLQISQIEITATGDEQGAVAISGGVVSGGGRLRIEGSSPAVPTAESPARLSLRGERFLAVQTSQVRMTVSPDLQVRATPGRVEVTGNVTVPTASIDALEFSSAAVPASRDVVFVGAETEEPQQPVDIAARIRLTLGDRVFFRGFGFSSRLEGSFDVVEEPGGATQGSGELVFREGIYRGQGQNLTIDPGRLLFSGPVDNPVLDVRAYREATDGTRAGLLLSGTLQQPRVEVWSDPAMSESDALAYMLLGRPFDQGSEADRNRVGNTAAVLGGSILTQRLGTRVGLDEARIEAGATERDAAFVAGKYLSPKLYVSYGVGLFEPVNTWRIRYLLLRNLTLQAEAGSRQSTDMLYRFERGR